MEFLEKENEKLKKDSRRMPLLWVCICVFTTVVMAMTGGFAGFVDGCIFFAILAGIMFVIYYFIFGRFFYGFCRTVCVCLKSAGETIRRYWIMPKRKNKAAIKCTCAYVHLVCCLRE